MRQSDGLPEGAVFAGYTIVRRLGPGMGEVYLAQHPRLPRRDALKILPGELTDNLEFRERFHREADHAASLYNEHIVGIHDRGEYEGQLWISMDYVEGTDAAQLLRQYPSGMPKADVVEIITAVADALDYAHSRGLLHRDVKPANILLTDATPRRRILLADFGIARELGEISGLTATNMMMGTTAYCAPEQLQGLDLDGRADQYALGCTAFNLLTGSAPFTVRIRRWSSHSICPRRHRRSVSAGPSWPTSTARSIRRLRRIRPTAMRRARISRPRWARSSAPRRRPRRWLRPKPPQWRRMWSPRRKSPRAQRRPCAVTGARRSRSRRSSASR